MGYERCVVFSSITFRGGRRAGRRSSGEPGIKLEANRETIFFMALLTLAEDVRAWRRGRRGPSQRTDKNFPVGHKMFSLIKITWPNAGWTMRRERDTIEGKGRGGGAESDGCGGVVSV